MNYPPLEEILAELERRERARSSEPAFLEGLHPKQKAFVLDPAKRKCALAGRRAGKSEGIAAWLLQDWEKYPGETSPFIARTAGHARRILWETLKRIEQRHKLPLRFREDILTVELPNKYKIWLSGAKDFSEVEKFRGPRYRRSAIDEAGSFPPALLQYLVDDIVDPALMDLDGELALTGSPNAVPAGYFYEKTTGDGGKAWTTHTWTCVDNPYVKGEAYLKRKLEDNGWTEDHPTFQREYLGRWVRDEQALVYPYDSAKNVFSELPEGQWLYGLGVDLGYEDSCAFVVGAHRRGHPEVYIVEVEKKSGLIPSAVAAYVERYRREYKCSSIVVDAGGLGKGYVEEMKQTYGIPAEPAQKQHKAAYIELVRGDMKSGNIKINPWKARGLLDEMSVLQWNEDRSSPDERFEDHACDAFLYLCRSLRPYYRPEEEPPKTGTAEWFERERLRMRKEAEQRVKKQLKHQRRFI